MLERGTELPAVKTRIFTTKEPIPDAVMVELVLGERLIASANQRIARIRVGGIKKTVGGVARIAVKLEVTEFAEISLEAFDYGSHHKNSIIIGNEWLPGTDDIKAALEDARASEEEENKIRESCRLIDRAKASVRVVNSLSNSDREGLSEADYSALKEKTKDLRKRLQKARPEKLTDIELKVITEEMNSINQMLSGL